MIKLLISKFVKNHEAVDNLQVRTAYGKLAGVLGIACNFILFILKLLAGIISGSVAVLSDAFNNLSDMGSSVVSLIGTTAASRHADEEHPFGHGRFEYIASLIVSFIIILVGFELLKTSFGKIFDYEKLNFSILSAAVLLFSMVVKLWLFVANRKIGNAVQSVVIRAAAQDSLNDVYATGAVLLSMILGLVVEAPIDGIMGIAISVLIMFSGYGIARDTITILLGTSPDPAMADEICRTILEQDCITGVHDLIIHDYGPGRCMASVHAEVPEDGDIVRVHEIIDETEKRIQKELGVHVVIHMDPISVSDARIESVRDLVLDCAQKINGEFSVHDFRMTDGEHCINLIFDLEVPFSVSPLEREQAAKCIQASLKEIDPRYNAVIQVENKSWQTK
ncbi:MAG: cation transporter [Clostridia bacterium]|nr:cation transporter [Clostridia bacterium]